MKIKPLEKLVYKVVFNHLSDCLLQFLRYTDTEEYFSCEIEHFLKDIYTPPESVRELTNN